MVRLSSETLPNNIIESSPQSPMPSPTPETMDLGKKDTVLLVVVDGVGHGPDAASVTIRILDCLRANYELDSVALVKECHEAALRSGGATLGIALLDQPNNRVHYLGVGDVAMHIVTEHRGASGRISFSSLDPSTYDGPFTRTLMNNNGTVGYRIPNRLRTDTYDYLEGDILLLGTDGIRTDLDFGGVKQSDALGAGAVAKSVVSAFGLDRDDATIIVAM